MTRSAETPATAAGPGAPEARSCPRWLKVALALSLLVNLLVFGVVAGAVLHHRGEERRGINVGPYGEALSPADREALRRAFLDHAPNWRELRRERGEDMAAVVAAVTAEPFDAAALEAAIGRQEERFRAGLGIGKALLVERITAMTPEERRAFARRLQAAHDRDHDED